MGEAVNRTSALAASWQRHVVWIRVNVGFIKAELAHLLASGHDTSNIQGLLDSFDSTFERFCRNELEVFVAARLSETEETKTSYLADRLAHMGESFLPWLEEYNDLVEAMASKAGDVGLPLVLLRSCGAELLIGHSKFVDIVDAYVEEIRRPAAQADEADAAPIAEAEFNCAICNKSAGTIQLMGTSASPEIKRVSFTSHLGGRIKSDQFERLRDALLRKDAQSIYELNLEWASFYCPKCKASYCGDHWISWDVFEDGFHDCIRGQCPSGHERMLED